VQRREKKKILKKKKPSLTSVKSILFPLHIILIFIISPEAIAENHSGLSKTDEPSEHKRTRGKKKKEKKAFKKTPHKGNLSYRFLSMIKKVAIPL
jgi:hypothetical protein